MKPDTPPDTTRRDVIIAVGAGLAVIGFIAFGIMNMGRTMTDYQLTGVILEKNFEPQPETQITIGKGGVSSRRLEGEFTFTVHVKSLDRKYTIWVDKPTYESHSVGDRYEFTKPPDR